MKNIDVPFNLLIPKIDKEALRGLRPVSSTYIFEGSSDNLHPEGLYSPIIFGRIGDEMRLNRFSYIDIRLQIFHPLIYRALCSMKTLHAGIMDSSQYAVWNSEKKCFEKSSPLVGRTGYQFFVEHWRDIVFEDTGSEERRQMIDYVNRYKDVALSQYVLVYPAGAREITIRSDGRTEEMEVNKSYRRLITLSSSIFASAVETNPEMYDKTRISLQRAFNEIVELFFSMIDGKKKMVLGKFASRKLFNGTRNVASAMNLSCKTIGHKENIGINNTVVGLFQYMKATLPVSVFDIKTKILGKIFFGANSPARLIDPATLRGVDVMVKPDVYEHWTSNTGIESVIEEFRNRDIRQREVKVEDYYLALIYVSPEGGVRVFHGIEELPSHIEVSQVRPIRLVELLYLSVYERSHKIPIFVTRYPIIGTGSIYPSFTYLYTTAKTKKCYPLGDDWKTLDFERPMNRFPTLSSFFDTSSPHPSRNEGLELDYDGDTISDNAVYTDNAIAENLKYFRERRAYVGINGKMRASVGIDTVNLVTYALTRDPNA